MPRPHPSPTLPLYVGGFIGPFGGAVLAVLIPQLRDAFGATTAEVAAAIPAYLVPFALLQLVSGTIGERLAAAASSARATSPTRCSRSARRWRRRSRRSSPCARCRARPTRS
ncbi:MAG TPA: hypothetical protein VM266_04855 [Solirubrobacteraceae bacterium]|nr:hypothetical protein [Solirubrobacteraceae bacterium]